MKQFIRWLCLSGVLVYAAEAQSLRLKNLTERHVVDIEQRRSKRANAAYLVVRFNAPITPAEAAALTTRGGRILAYVPDNAYLVRAPGSMSLSELGVVSASRLSAALKVSPAAAPVDLFVVEFHPDVEPAEARRLVEELGLEVRDHPDLLPHHLLVAGTQADVATLAEWEEVAYVFPASPELALHEPLIGCAGAVFQAADSLVPIGQYVSHAGDGWDGPGKNAAELKYIVVHYTGKLPQPDVAAEITRALDQWSGAARIAFQPGADASAPRTIAIQFAAKSHGDPFPFDGPGRVLAHTFYPAPPNPEPLAGDLHLDDEENWQIGADIDLYSVVLHELGHALGLGHSDVPGAVMYPYYRRANLLTAEDILAIQELYAGPDGTPPPPVSPLQIAVAAPSPTTTSASAGLSGTVLGGRDPVGVTWSTAAGATGAASGNRSWSAVVPLVVGQNQITITATDGADARASVTTVITRRASPLPASIRITAPATATTFTSLSPTISLSGTASHASGIAGVEWTNSLNTTGAASLTVINGVANWTASAIPLRGGANTLTVKAVPVEGAPATVTVSVTYTPPGSDTTRPSLTIHSPASTNVGTTSETIAFRGVASDNVGVTSVVCVAPSGTVTASGTAYWSCENIKLRLGLNMIVVEARDAAGNLGWRSVAVTRR